MYNKYLKSIFVEVRINLIKYLVIPIFHEFPAQESVIYVKEVVLYVFPAFNLHTGRIINDCQTAHSQWTSTNVPFRNARSHSQTCMDVVIPPLTQ